MTGHAVQRLHAAPVILARCMTGMRKRHAVAYSRPGFAHDGEPHVMHQHLSEISCSLGVREATE